MSPFDLWNFAHGIVQVSFPFLWIIASVDSETNSLVALKVFIRLNLLLILAERAHFLIPVAEAIYRTGLRR